MLYSLDLYIKTDSEVISAAIGEKVADKLDNQVWEIEYKKEIGVNEAGLHYIAAEVRFKNKSDRQIAFNWIRSKKDQVIDLLHDDSYLRLHDCPHRKQGEGNATPGEKCKITWLWTKLEGVIIS